MFDPAFAHRSLGIFTMLKEIAFAMENGKEFYYQGYSYEGPSFYDYKNVFAGLRAYDWNGNWSFVRGQALAADDADKTDEERI